MPDLAVKFQHRCSVHFSSIIALAALGGTTSISLISFCVGSSEFATKQAQLFILCLSFLDLREE